MNATKKPALKLHILFILAFALFAQAPLQATADSASYSWWKICAAVVATIVGITTITEGYVMWNSPTTPNTFEQLNQHVKQLKETREKEKLQKLATACAVIRFKNNFWQPYWQEPAVQRNMFIRHDLNSEITQAKKDIKNILKNPPNMNSSVQLVLGTNVLTGEIFLVKAPLITAAVASGDPDLVRQMINAHADINTPVEPFTLSALLLPGTLVSTHYNPERIQQNTATLNTFVRFKETNPNLLYCLMKRNLALDPQNISTQTQLDDIIKILRDAGAADPLGLATMPRVPLAMNE